MTLLNKMILELKQLWTQARLEERPLNREEAFEVYYIKYKLYLEHREYLRKMALSSG